jgi:hypothetical protein
MTEDQFANLFGLMMSFPGATLDEAIKESGITDSYQQVINRLFEKGWLYYKESEILIRIPT